MKKARVHIGKVTFKDTGAVVHRMPPRHDNIVIQHMRAATARMMNQTPQPDCYFIVTIRFDRETPGLPEFEATWCTCSDAMPLPLLAETAGAVLKAEVVAWRAQCRTMDALGYQHDGWHPEDDDPAA